MGQGAAKAAERFTLKSIMCTERPPKTGRAGWVFNGRMLVDLQRAQRAHCRNILPKVNRVSWGMAQRSWPRIV